MTQTKLNKIECIKIKEMLCEWEQNGIISYNGISFNEVTCKQSISL